jgi:putative flippase GtrA
LIVSAQTASAIGYILGSIVNYYLNYLFTFNSTQAHKKTASKYFSVLAVGWGINFVLMGLLVNWLNWYYWFAQFISTGLVLLWNFSGSKWWAFGGQMTDDR